ncbi:MAG UNVERIFIED_CONTAM: hypothetical protein LVQ98_01305 [Rickettsiaceae bacterium]|jgi:DNA primase
MHYLSERRLSEDNIAKYSIGFSSSGKELIKYMEECNIPLTIMHDAGLIGKNDDGEIYPVFRNRIMFPIRNIYSKIIAFGEGLLVMQCQNI